MTRFAFPFLIITLALALASFYPSALADGPSDNQAENVRPIPPPGIAIPTGQREKLESGLQELTQAVDQFRKDSKEDLQKLRLLPDIEVCAKAVRDAMLYGEFHKDTEVEFAFELLEIGKTRLRQLREGQSPWLRQSGMVIRGYRSEIDESVQPYGLEIPADYDFESPRPTRLDFWFHGRGEKLSEVSFLQQRHLGRGGKIQPAHAIVLHPYGRYSNANKFAGEVDLFEALADAGNDYRIDRDRIFVRGFSMGGAACWQFAVHFADRWAGAQPGAGFSETPEFLRTFQGETLNPFPWEEKLWRWYDATHWALNLSQVPTIAYSGELDRQKQAADMMVAAAEAEGIRLLHLIGPETEHKIHPDSLEEIEQRLGRISHLSSSRVPESVQFVTYTLRYNTMHWLRVDALTRHWEKSLVRAQRSGPGAIDISTEGIEGFTLDFAAGECWLDVLSPPKITIDGTAIECPRVFSDLSYRVSFVHSDGTWRIRDESREDGPELRKKHLLQGPIDDAFMSRFLHISPTGQETHPLVGDWIDAELPRARDHWRKQFRGDALHREDREVTAEDHANANLVLWGTPASNSVLREVLEGLPIEWTDESIRVGGQSFPAEHHVVALVYPNPKNPERYLVLNSGFTYREYDYLNNARQTPKLPDWAVIDLRTPPSSRYPGKIVAGGFFDEEWRLSSPNKP